jgi:hypothetical protein
MTNIPISPGELVDVPCLSELARAHWRKTTAKGISNTTATTDMLNGEITIDAGAMETVRSVRLTAKLTSDNTFGLTASIRWSLALGGTTLLDSNAIANGWSNGTIAWIVRAEISNYAATNQNVSLDVEGCGSNNGVAASGNFITGAGGYCMGAGASSYIHRALGVGTATKNTAGALALALNAKMGTASANLAVTLTDAYVEIV